MKYRNFVYKMTRVRGRLDNMIKKYLIPIDILEKCHELEGMDGTAVSAGVPGMSEAAVGY